MQSIHILRLNLLVIEKLVLTIEDQAKYTSSLPKLFSAVLYCFISG